MVLLRRSNSRSRMMKQVSRVIESVQHRLENPRIKRHHHLVFWRTDGTVRGSAVWKPVIFQALMATLCIAVNKDGKCCWRHDPAWKWFTELSRNSYASVTDYPSNVLAYRGRLLQFSYNDKHLPNSILQYRVPQDIALTAGMRIGRIVSAQQVFDAL